MGKAARNERRKITAAYANNIAVGLCFTGAFVPLYALLASDWIFQSGYGWRSNGVRDEPL